METKRKLRAEIQRLKNEVATCNVLLRAYIQSNHKLQDEVALLNESLDCTAAELERWRDIAHKADERRLNYVRNMDSTAGTH